MTKKANEVIKKATPKKTPSKKTVKSKSSTTKTKKTTVKEQVVLKPKKKKRGIKTMLKNLISSLKRHKFVTMFIVTLLVLFLAVYMVITKVSLDKTVVTIDNREYTKSDFMIYLYSIKYNYFGKDNTDLSNTTLNTKLNDDSGMTVQDYLRDKTVLELKMAAAIKEIAEENNLELTSKLKKELEEEKKEYIESIGGKKEFRKILRHNHTTEEAYDKMAETDKLYKLIYDSLYADGKANDLTEEEKKSAHDEYYSSYKRIKQIILVTIDTSTNKSLGDTVINQKQTLANSILEEAKSGTDFDALIKKYSEDAIDKEPPYDAYYKDGELLEELEEAVDKLNTGDISEVIKTKYAFHIIQKQELDDGKLNDVYEEKREEKLLKTVSEKLETISIIYQKEFDELKIK